MRRVFAMAGVLAGLSVLGHARVAPAAAGAAEKDIVDTAVAAGQFKTLVKAVEAADLAATLRKPGPFTVFAPTDEAFAAVPKEKLEALLKDKKQLAAVLTYHVVPGKVTAADVAKLQTAKTVQGQPLKISVKSGEVRVNDAKVIKTDIMCSNGVIHVIDAVLLPPEGGALAPDPAFKPLLEAKLPDGFPEPTPVGEIRVKSYPAYRLARAARSGQQADGQLFLTLFKHISRGGIKMTAPVEMTYASGKENDNPEQEAMAFLYENQRTGTPGKDGEVEVLDVPAMTAVSIGLRGDYTPERIGEARGRLEAWLKHHADRYEAAGPLRVMGYNSPMVPAEKRYAEVEFPVRANAASS